MEDHRAPRHRNGTHPHDGGDFECSGRSCAAAMIADCVALCCCPPCAVVNFLAFAFVKVPWAVGRRCLAAGKRKRKKKKSQETTKWSAEYDSDGDVVEEDSRKRWWKEEGIFGISQSEEEFEAEMVWLELYQIGHLGFGRRSFTGVQPQFKGN